MFELPTSLHIGDTDYHIRNDGDYRMVLDCFAVFHDTALDENYKLLTCLTIFYDGMTSMMDVYNKFGDNLKTAATEMYNFFNCGQQSSIGHTTNYVLVSWTQDEQLIAAAVNSVYKGEIRSVPYMHWWTFMGYYISIGESVFTTVIQIRNKLKKGKKLEKYEKEFRRENPQYFVWDSTTDEDKATEALVRQLWDSGGG